MVRVGSGIIKDILLVLLGVFLMANRVSQLQAIGFSISVAGLIMYKVRTMEKEIDPEFRYQSADTAMVCCLIGPTRRAAANF